MSVCWYDRFINQSVRLLVELFWIFKTLSMFCEFKIYLKQPAVKKPLLSHYHWSRSPQQSCTLYGDTQILYRHYIYIFLIWTGCPLKKTSWYLIDFLRKWFPTIQYQKIVIISRNILGFDSLNSTGIICKVSLQVPCNFFNCSLDISTLAVFNYGGWDAAQDKIKKL